MMKFAFEDNFEKKKKKMVVNSIFFFVSNVFHHFNNNTVLFSPNQKLGNAKSSKAKAELKISSGQKIGRS